MTTTMKTTMTTNQIPALYMTTYQVTVMGMITYQIMEVLILMSENLMTSQNVTLTFMTLVPMETMVTMILTPHVMTHRSKW